MNRKVYNFIHSNWGKFLLLGWVWLFFAALPLQSLWIDLERVSVDDAILGAPIQMDVERHIKRDFTGLWRVEIRRADGDVFVCVGRSDDDIDYFSFAKMPEPLFLAWWIGRDALERCHRAGFGVGQYYLYTCQTVIRPFYGFVPRKTRCVRSNDFTVRPRE